MEAKEALDELLGLEELNKVPFLILGNKIDDPKAKSEPELRDILGLYQTTGKGRGQAMEGVRPIEVSEEHCSMTSSSILTRATRSSCAVSSCDRATARVSSGSRNTSRSTRSQITALDATFSGRII